MESQSDLRRKYRAARKDLSPAFREKASIEICERIRSILSDRDPAAVLSFYPLGQEPDIRPAMEEILDQGIPLYLPVTFLKEKEIRFYRVKDLSDQSLKEGTMHILEPAARREEYVSSSFPSGKKGPVISLTPGLVFDHEMGRIGYGGGFYDRFYSAHPEVLKAAVAYDLQVIRRGLIPQGPHDIPVDLILTEEGIYA